jgi:hypothetical protein
MATSDDDSSPERARPRITQPQAGSVSARLIVVRFTAPTKPRADYKLRLSVVSGGSTDYDPDADGVLDPTTRLYMFTVSAVPVPQPKGTRFTLALRDLVVGDVPHTINMQTARRPWLRRCGH